MAIVLKRDANGTLYLDKTNNLLPHYEMGQTVQWWLGGKEGGELMEGHVIGMETRLTDEESYVLYNVLTDKDDQVLLYEEEIAFYIPEKELDLDDDIPQDDDEQETA